MRGLFVTGTDTGVGKTIVTAGLAGALRAEGLDAGISKPVQSGHAADDPEGDTMRLVTLSGLDERPDRVNLYSLKAPLAPLVAARMEGVCIEPGPVVEHVRRGASGREAILVEGAGGFLVPLAPDWTVADLAAALDLPVLIVARPGLGTVNHTLLTVIAVRRAGLQVAGVVLNGWDTGTDASRYSNAALVEEFARVRVLGQIPRLSGLLTPGRLRAMINDHVDLEPLRRCMTPPRSQVPAAGGIIH